MRPISIVFVQFADMVLGVKLDAELGDQLRELLNEREVAATRRRAQVLVDSCVFPQPDPTRPAVPWPPF